MCGIVGFNWADPQRISEMMKLIIERGPDDCGHYINEKISLGHRRLSILDLSRAGHQPMLDEEKSIIIIYNGEIYNYCELKIILQNQGFIFNTNSDTEVVLYAYKAWGSQFIEKLEGMFAFVIYDIKKNILFFARDHVGMKPLYYYIEGTKIIFSSTIAPILAHEIITFPNAKLIRDYLLFNVSDHMDETFFTGIMKFPKGHYCIYNLESHILTFHKWWKNKYNGDYSGTYETAKNEFKNLLMKSVKKHLISDVPIGVCLSGGIDSSSIACLLKAINKKGIGTFSAVYKNFSLDESKYIDIVISESHLQNNKIYLDELELGDYLSILSKSIGEPYIGPSLFAQSCVFELAKNNGAIVLIDGQGSDEILAGYHYFYGFYIKGLIYKGKILDAIKKTAYHIIYSHSIVGFFSIFFLLLPRKIQLMFFKRKSGISQTLFQDANSTTNFFTSYYSCKDLHEALSFHMDFKLEQLLKYEDRTSMNYSREAREPFLDKNLIIFVYSLPEEYIINQGLTKAILRDSMKGIVPEKVLRRTDKIGYDIPENEWLQTESMKSILLDWFINNDPLCKEYIDYPKIRKLIMHCIQGRKRNGRLIWKIVILEAWFKEFFKKGHT